MTKEDIRELLKMLEDNMDGFKDHSLQFIDKKELRKLISVWRWYVSHDYFNEKHNKPEAPASNPPLPWLYGQLQGLSVPLHRDIARCIEPVVQSSLMTEHAARRIMDRLKMIYGYVSPEDAKADQEAAHKRKVLDKLDAKKHAEYEKARRDKIRLKPPTAAEYAKAEAEFLKLRDKQRKEAIERRERATAESIKRFDEDTRRLRRGGN